MLLKDKIWPKVIREPFSQKALDFIRSRTPNSIDDLPKAVKEKLKQINLPNHTIYLIGSYANGHWVDETTPEWFIEELKKSKDKVKKVSDIDLVVIPYKVIEGFDCTPHAFYSNEKQLLIQNGHNNNHSSSN